MRVHLCGVRGSTSAPGSDFVGVGGNTSCVALAHDTGPWCLILDAGTGIRSVTDLLDGEPFRGTVLLGHLHLDHTQGLPFFAAADRPDAEVHVVIPEQGVDAETLIERCYSPPHFPITLGELLGSWTFDGLDEGVHEIEGFTVTALGVPHAAGRTLGYRVSDGASAIAYLSDHGPDAHTPSWDAVVELVRGVDALIHDCQFTAEEQLRLKHYGHCTPQVALQLAEAADVRRLVMFHHAPTRVDADVDRMAAELDPTHVDVIVGREGMELRLP